MYGVTMKSTYQLRSSLHSRCWQKENSILLYPKTKTHGVKTQMLCHGSWAQEDMTLHSEQKCLEASHQAPIDLQMGAMTCKSTSLTKCQLQSDLPALNIQLMELSTLLPTILKVMSHRKDTLASESTLVQKSSWLRMLLSHPLNHQSTKFV